LLAARLIYEQTYLTWSEGPQMVGYALAHAFSGLLMLGLLCMMICLIAFISGLVFVAWKRSKITVLDWVLLGLLATFTFWIFVPYGTWQALTIRLLGVGRRPGAQLSYAAATGDYRLTRFLIARGVPFNGSNPKIHMTLAAALRKEGDLEGAIREYRKAIAVAPGYAEAYLAMGQALEQKGDFQSALEQYQAGCVQLGGLKCCDLAEKLAQRLNH